MEMDKKQTTPITAHAIFLLYNSPEFSTPWTGRVLLGRFAVETGVVDIWPEDSKLEADAGTPGNGLVVIQRYERQINHLHQSPQLRH